jgi:hypothetical protein
MMTRIIKNIRIIFLFLAAFILNAHMIIPHDHHASDSDACQENRCPVSNDGTNHNRPFPVHCHAFNDLASEKAIVYHNVKHFQGKDIIPDCIFNFDYPNLKLSLIRYSDLFLFAMPVKSSVLELTSLRAPPLLN